MRRWLVVLAVLLAGCSSQTPPAVHLASTGLVARPTAGRDLPLPYLTRVVHRASRSRHVVLPIAIPDIDPVVKTLQHVVKTVQVHIETAVGAAAWANSSAARRVAQCESGGDPYVVSGHGGTTYFGKWQMNSDFVSSYGGGNAWSWVHGGRFTMPESMQDSVAYRGYQARGWNPWSCARIVGVY